MTPLHLDLCSIHPIFGIQFTLFVVGPCIRPEQAAVILVARHAEELQRVSDRQCVRIEDQHLGKAAQQQRGHLPGILACLKARMQARHRVRQLSRIEPANGCT